MHKIDLYSKSLCNDRVLTPTCKSQSKVRNEMNN